VTGSGRARVVRAGLYGLAAAHLIEAVMLRRQRGRIAELPAPDDEANRRVDVVAAEGAEVGRVTRAGAAQVVDSGGVEAVDLVPGDMPAARALRLLRRVESDRLREDPMYSPGGAHEAVALQPSLAERMDVQGGRTLDRGDLVRETVKAQRYAPTRSEVRLAPSLRATPYGPGDRWRELEALTAYTGTYGSLAPVLVLGEAIHLLAMTAGLVVAPVPALAALATWSAQPALVFGGPGGALRPPDVGRASARRLLDAWSDNLRTAAAGWRQARAAAAERAQAGVPTPPPLEELFEPRRDACAWCGSSSLVGRLDINDLLQHKPGTFHLDECTACGHIFQNPALSVAGLNYYYDEYYEGAGEEPWERIFSAMAPAYRNRVEAVARFTRPRRWLDVGTGHGHFCLTARQQWPDTRFDGLDMSESVEEAKRRGWIDTAHRGFFPEMADELAGSYDVVSMHHYLEHTRDPRRELAAAAQVLQPGGYLMIETPDTASPWSHRLGRYWRCWFQPQHLHFVTHDNLVAALEREGFEVVSSERGPASEGLDLSSAVFLALDERLRSPELPWLPRPSAAHRATRLAVMTAALPVMAVAAASDTIKDARDRRPDSKGPGNAYRVVARRL
jgi:SAM-dependent methyltransferase